MSKLPKPWIPIDDEKIPTTTITSVQVGNVLLTSRYQKRAEFLLLTKMAFALDDDMREAIKSIDCDSKACDVFTVEMMEGLDDKAITGPIGENLDTTLWFVNGGHNGVYVGDTTVVDPDWDEDEDDA